LREHINVIGTSGEDRSKKIEYIHISDANVRMVKPVKIILVAQVAYTQKEEIINTKFSIQELSWKGTILEIW
jgi:hypothetical protein